MADTPLGKGLIEIGANITPLESGLARAQTRATEYITTIASGLDTAAPTAFAAAMRPAESSLRNSATSAADIANQIDRATGAIRQFQAAQQQQATQQVKNQRLLIDSSTGKELSTVAGAGAGASAAEAVKTYVSNMSSATTTTVQVADGAKKIAENTKAAANESKFLSVGVAGMAGAVAGLGRALNELWKGIKGFGDGARALANDLKNIESQFRSDITASLDPISKRTQEIENQKKAALDALETERASRGIIGDIVGLVSDEAEMKIKIQKIENEAAAAQQRNREAQKKANEEAAKEATKKAEEAAKVQEEEDAKSAEEAAKVARQAYIQTLDEKGKLEAEFQDEAKALEEKANSARTEAERNSYLEAIGFLEQTKNKKIADIIETETKQKESNKAIGGEAKEVNVEAMKEQLEMVRNFHKEQRDMIKGLRDEVNSLFNTGNMEVAAGQINSLMNVLISKTGDR